MEQYPVWLRKRWQVRFNAMDGLGETVSASP
jgi:hypothetical protein